MWSHSLGFASRVKRAWICSAGASQLHCQPPQPVSSLSSAPLCCGACVAATERQADRQTGREQEREKERGRGVPPSGTKTQAAVRKPVTREAEQSRGT